MRALLRLVLIVLPLAAAACGQAGDLYLPDESAAPPAPAAASEPAPAPAAADEKR